jgi:GMP synthase (glutamine-hydrolysing)
VTTTALARRFLAFEDLGILDEGLRAHGYDTRYLDAGVDELTADSVVGADLEGT